LAVYAHLGTLVRAVGEGYELEEVPYQLGGFSLKSVTKAIKKVAKAVGKGAEAVGKAVVAVKKPLITAAGVIGGIALVGTGAGAPLGLAVIGTSIGAAVATPSWTAYGKPKKYLTGAAIGGATGFAVGAVGTYLYEGGLMAPAAAAPGAGVTEAGAAGAASAAAPAASMSAGEGIAWGSVLSGAGKFAVTPAGLLLAKSLMSAAGITLPGTSTGTVTVPTSAGLVDAGVPAGWEGGTSGGGGGGGAAEGEAAPVEAAPAEAGWLGLSTNTWLLIGAGAVVVVALAARSRRGNRK
jgi:hypothetical protein